MSFHRTGAPSLPPALPLASHSFNLHACFLPHRKSFVVNLSLPELRRGVRRAPRVGWSSVVALTQKRSSACPTHSEEEKVAGGESFRCRAGKFEYGDFTDIRLSQEVLE